jgi:hypothetical protein
MEFVAFALSVPGVTVLLLFWVMWTRRRRNRFLKALESHACKVCGAGFDDTIPEDLGAPARDLLERLDRFQRRFAHRVVRCPECQSLNVCTREGVPFRGIPEV